MRHSVFTRTVAAASGALLLQLSWLASGTLCRMQHETHDAMTMASAVPSHAAHGVGQVPSVNPEPEPCHTSGTCDAPWSQDAGCASMATCVTAVSASVMSPEVTTTRAPDRVAIVRTMDMPLGPAFAPELPPPRA